MPKRVMTVTPTAYTTKQKYLRAVSSLGEEVAQDEESRHSSNSHPYSVEREQGFLSHSLPPHNRVETMNNTDGKLADEQTVLSSLPYYDSIRLNQTGEVLSIRREAAEKLDWLKTTDSGIDIPICHVAGIAGMTLFQIPEINGYQELVSSMLAFQHLNDGDGSIAPDVEGLNERCPIKFTFDLQDNMFSRPLAAQQTIEALGRLEGSLEERKPCAFYGARQSLISIVMATLTGINDYLQLAALSESPALDDQAQFPLFGRTTPNQSGTTDAIVTYLNKELGVKHLATINANNEFGNTFADGIRASIARLGLEMSVLQFPYETDDRDSQRKAVELFKKSNYRYVYLASGGYYRHVENIIEEALDLSVGGVETHTWFFHLAIHELNGFVPVPKGSPKHLVFRGHGFIAPINVNNPGPDVFVEQVKVLQNPVDLEYTNSFFRPFWEPNRDDARYMSIASQIENGQFLDNLISQVEDEKQTNEALSYDAAIAMGLATCDAYAKHGPSFTGRDQFQSLLDLSFTGLSGKVQFLETGTRDQSTFNYGMFTTFEEEYNETHVTMGKRIAGRRIDGEWQFVNDFLFNDGTANIPHDLPPVQTSHDDISASVRGVTLAMCTVVLVSVIGFAFWTNANSNEHVVRASQPFFLYTLLTGIAILASSIIPITIDQSMASLDACVIACNSSVWLVSVGFCVTFSALFTKNYRINRILKASQRMKRVKVTIADTIVPMVALLLGKLGSMWSARCEI